MPSRRGDVDKQPPNREGIRTGEREAPSTAIHGQRGRERKQSVHKHPMRSWKPEKDGKRSTHTDSHPERQSREGSTAHQTWLSSLHHTFLMYTATVLLHYPRLYLPLVRCLITYMYMYTCIYVLFMAKGSFPPFKGAMSESQGEGRG